MELDWDMLRRPTDPAPVLVRRFVQLFVGLFLYGIGIALIVRGELGVAPWDVLTQGIAKQTGLNFGLITILTSGVVLLLWIPIRQKPGFGTVMNALLVGPFADLGLWLIPPGLDLWIRALLLPAGIVVLAIATGLYIGAHFGPGPRDEDGEYIKMDVEEGDEIIFSKYGGTEIKLGADEVLILRESDVLAKVVTTGGKGKRKLAGAAA